MANAPRPGVGRRADADTLTVGVRVDGTDHVLRPNEVTARQAGMLRRETGFSFRRLMVEAENDPDLDVIAAFVWLARLQAGEDVSYATVADALGYESEIEELTAGDAEAASEDLPSL